MAKVTNQDIKDRGFDNPEMFGLSNEAALDNFIDDIIADKGAELNGILGSTYDSATEPTKSRIKRAEAYLVITEMLQRRINRLLSNVSGAGQELDTSNERKQLDDYSEKADRLINMLLGDTDFSVDTVETSHFEETAELGGLEVLE